MSAPAIISSGTSAGGPPVGGSGTTNTIPRWTGASTLGDSVITQNSTALVTTGSSSATQTTFRVRTVGTANNAPVFSLYREGVNEQVIWAGSGTIRFGFATDPAGYTDAQLLAATKMGIDASGNVGIGTTTPGYRLHVKDATNRNMIMTSGTTGMKITSLTDAGAEADIGVQGNTVQFLTGGTERARIDSSGNFGIGETSPASYGRLAVTGSAVGAGILGMNTDATRVDIQSYNKPLAINRAGNNTLMNEGGGNVGIGTASPSYDIDLIKTTAGGVVSRIRNSSAAAAAEAVLMLNASGNSWGMSMGSTAKNSNALTWVLDYGGANTEMMRLTTTGNVGIGTASPAFKLEVAAGTASAMRLVSDSGTATVLRLLQTANRDWGIRIPASSTSLSFYDYSAGQERMVIDLNGNVGIGTASPNAILSVYNAGTPTISLWNSSNYTRFSTNTNDCFIDVGLGGTAGAVVFRRSSGATESARIDSNGNIYGTSGTTGMTNGFFYIPAAAGAPTGVPTAVAGRVPMYYDTTNNQFYVYNGAWKKVTLA